MSKLQIPLWAHTSRIHIWGLIEQDTLNYIHIYLKHRFKLPILFTQLSQAFSVVKGSKYIQKSLLYAMFWPGCLGKQFEALYPNFRAYFLQWIFGEWGIHPCCVQTLGTSVLGLNPVSQSSLQMLPVLSSTHSLNYLQLSAMLYFYKSKVTKSKFYFLSHKKIKICDTFTVLYL